MTTQAPASRKKSLIPPCQTSGEQSANALHLADGRQSLSPPRASPPITDGPLSQSCGTMPTRQVDVHDVDGEDDGTGERSQAAHCEQVC